MEQLIKFRFSNRETIESKAPRMAEDRRSSSANVMGDRICYCYYKLFIHQIHSVANKEDLNLQDFVNSN